MKTQALCSLLVLFVLAGCCLRAEKPDSGADLFGPTEPERYLTGRFEPAGHPLFVSVSAAGIPTGGRDILLRREAVVALGALLAALRKDHPGVPFHIISGTRTWASQKGIWERKWTGQTLVEGRRLDQAFPDPVSRARKILEFSSMPGTSRHHWGSDFDFNSLNNAYFKQGQGRIIYLWMQKNAARFGFCQPYTEGRSGGYLEERWHWSYRPLSAGLLKQWRERIEPARPKMMGAFAGSDAAVPLAVEYVETIHPACR